jgi:hypothetical protein
MESPIVHDELEKIQIMMTGVEALSDIVESGNANVYDLIQYMDLMYKCLDMQSIFWTRISLSDDVELEKTKQEMIKMSLQCGRYEHESVSQFYFRIKDELSKYIEELFEELEKECLE